MVEVFIFAFDASGNLTAYGGGHPGAVIQPARVWLHRDTSGWPIPLPNRPVFDSLPSRGARFATCCTVRFECGVGLLGNRWLWCRTVLSVLRRERGKPSRRMIEQPCLESMVGVKENERPEQEQREAEHLLPTLACRLE